MQTRYSLRLGSRKPVNREWALASLAANVALPGAGTLLVGRVTGYLQFGMALSGMVLTTIHGMRFIHWALEHRATLEGPEQVPWESLGLIWMQLRMPLLGIGLFGGGWVWSVVSSLVLLWRSWRNRMPLRQSGGMKVE
jgi:hypothetical protein